MGPIPRTLLRPRRWRILAAVLVLATLTWSLPRSTNVAAQGDDSAGPLDLAALTLTPADLADEGLEGYGVGFGQTTFPEGLIAGVAADRGLPEADVREILEDAGFARAYHGYLYVPADEDDPAGLVGRVILSYVFEYADAAGAADAWELLEDESDSETAEDLRGVENFGDQSEATRDTGEDSASGDEFAALDLSFRLGNLHAGVTVTDWVGEEPAIAEAEPLAERLLERVEAALDEGGSGIGSQVLRLTGEEILPSADYYLLRDGEPLPLYGEASADAEARADAAADVDQTDGYRLWQQIAAGGEGTEDDAWFLVELNRFADEDAASDWLAESEDRVEANAAFDNVEFDDDVPSVGDEAIGYTLETADGGAFYRGMALRAGDMVAVIDVIAPETPPADAVAALAEAQAACLDDGGCVEPLPLPDDLRDVLAGPEDAGGEDEQDEEEEEASRDEEADEPPSAEETPESAGDDTDADGSEGTYESPTYGFTLTYDPAVWTVSTDEDAAADERLTLDNGVSTVWLVGDPDYAPDELADCVETYLLDQGFDDGAWEVEPIEDLVDEDGRAYATYALENPVLGLTGYLSLECRAIGDGNTLVIVHVAGTEAVENEDDGVPDDEVDAVEELLAGLALPDGQTGNDDEEEGEADEASAGTRENDPATGGRPPARLFRSRTVTGPAARPSIPGEVPA